MLTARLRNLSEYLRHRENNSRIFDKINEIENNMSISNSRKFTVKGYSYPAKSEVKFLVDYNYSDKIKINWRERVVCPKTNLNNRLRAAVHFMNFELGVKPDSKIYIAEQLTPLYKYLKRKFPSIIGSEFLNSEYSPGKINHSGIRHEDATDLSFRDCELDFYLTFECFEHIPGYEKAFIESYRVLKENGVLFWTVPFLNYSYDNLIRANINEDGIVNHIHPPEYHGDPVNPKGGILCYQHFGWKMFDQLKSIGFKDAYAVSYWCDALGYYGGEQFLFFAIK